MKNQIPFVDLKKQYVDIKEDINNSINKVLNSGSFILGEEVSKFEEDFSKLHGVKYGVAVNSGTAALHLALLSSGIKPGDEVITVPNTFIATAEAISHCGSKPVFVDIDEDSYCIDVNKIEEKITNKTKAIIPVHLYGQMADMDEIMKIAKKYNLKVIEDACQSHLAEYNGKKAGSIGDVGCFSFYPGKNLGAYGEGGIIITNHKDIADMCKRFRSHGESMKHMHDVIGYNYRMEGIQGAILNVKLKHLENWTNLRRKNASIYNNLLEGIVKLPKELENRKHVYHLYIIETKNRDKLIDYLKDNGVSTGIHYQIPIHLQNAYKNLNYKEGSFNVTEKVVKNIISLPMFPELKEEEIKHVCDLIKSFYKGGVI